MFLDVWILFVRSSFKLLFMGSVIVLSECSKIVKQYTTERDDNDINHDSRVPRSLFLLVLRAQRWN